MLSTIKDKAECGLGVSAIEECSVFAFSVKSPLMASSIIASLVLKQHFKATSPILPSLIYSLCFYQTCLTFAFKDIKVKGMIWIPKFLF